jgi:predicted DNA-binding transcriptional regulator AlpA
MRPLTLHEAAQFLRMSKSSLYQRKDIPRFRRPGSRALLFDQDELEAWVRTGRLESAFLVAAAGEPTPCTSHSISDQISLPKKCSIGALDFQGTGVYHRNPRYR